jgi:hypothetical protein
MSLKRQSHRRGGLQKENQIDGWALDEAAVLAALVPPYAAFHRGAIAVAQIDVACLLNAHVFEPIHRNRLPET